MSMGVACILEAVQRFKIGGKIGTNSGLIETKFTWQCRPAHYKMRTKDSAKFTIPFSLKGGVWGQEYKNLARTF